ncbi:uracil-DNA glycosylase family protein [Roseiconus lacunae]|uniref:Single-stranded DNA-binding protein n=1 Tax=Roseiconus lacunae TaxID=2605694 RepID=A0ABT7PQJ2_9BACT|nr:uracil-DNA glycosylase family protein [Roseiconus lacunae]MCD0461833.1 single-stranded DNA-binding protein [Roseiconus lacunae]MDM4018544.1 single-stranded DNA-binding protein [Roseiconus lacunae]WRQ52602.1 uracil-DNA glycosylase family protein [Stieleria sp. HD01]
MAAETLIKAARKLSKAVDRLQFSEPVTHVYNPLAYARRSHEAYLSMIGDDVSVVFLGMNPGPWGMAQTGVPFGEIAAVRDWMQIDEPIGRPDNEHEKRPVEGLQCARSEVSGRRLWGLFQEKFETPEAFFAKHFVLNYCPLVFMEASARNRTPDKLPAAEKTPLDSVCDEHLRTVLKAIKPEHAVGVGAYAEACLRRVVKDIDEPPQVSRILHPSPASPAANRDWAGTATKQLCEAGLW